MMLIFETAIEKSNYSQDNAMFKSKSTRKLMYAKYLYPMWHGTKSVSPNSNLGGSICWTGLDTLVIDSERGWDEMKRCCSGGGASACSAFDVLMRKLSKMSNKSGSDSVVAVALVGIFPFSFLLLTLLPKSLYISRTVGYL